MSGDASRPASPRRLAVLVDGTPMPEPEALAFWERFSTWMEDHRGDLAGFAAAEGYASVHPGVDGNRPVLRASKSAAQRPYSAVSAEAPAQDAQRGERPTTATGGSNTNHRQGAKADRRGGRSRRKPAKP